MVRRMMKETGRISFKMLCVATSVSVALFGSCISGIGARPYSYALGLNELPAYNELVQLTPAFTPAVLKGISVNPDDPLTIDFILDDGNAGLTEEQLENEAKKLTGYFLATLTIPERDLWVNLSVFEENKVVPDDLGETELGKDLLAQDYLLKQLLASFMHPDNEVGRQFWQRVYEKAQEIFGRSDVPVNTFNKIWIVPEKAVVYERGTEAFVGESRLKVMLENDYRAMKNMSPQDTVAPEDKTVVMNREAAAILKELIIPLIEKEVNEGSHFASLRQIYNSLILSAWYKQRMVDSIVNQAYADKGKVAGIDTADPAFRKKVFDRYAQAYKKGMYNVVKKEYDGSRGKNMQRKYVSGGISLAMTSVKTPSLPALPAVVEGMPGVVPLLPTAEAYSPILTIDNQLPQDAFTRMGTEGERLQVRLVPLSVETGTPLSYEVTSSPLVTGKEDLRQSLAAMREVIVPVLNNGQFEPVILEALSAQLAGTPAGRVEQSPIVPALVTTMQQIGPQLSALPQAQPVVSGMAQTLAEVRQGIEVPAVSTVVSGIKAKQEKVDVLVAVGQGVVPNTLNVNTIVKAPEGIISIRTAQVPVSTTAPALTTAAIVESIGTSVPAITADLGFTPADIATVGVTYADNLAADLKVDQAGITSTLSDAGFSTPGLSVQTITPAQFSGAMTASPEFGGIDLDTTDTIEMRGNGAPIVFNSVSFDLSQFAGFEATVEIIKP